MTTARGYLPEHFDVPTGLGHYNAFPFLATRFDAQFVPTTTGWELSIWVKGQRYLKSGRLSEYTADARFDLDELSPANRQAILAALRNDATITIQEATEHLNLLTHPETLR